jgi:HEAT repeat protein
MERYGMIAEWIAALHGSSSEQSFCRLKSAPEALRHLIEALDREPDARRRATLVHFLWQLRDPAALPTIATALEDVDERVWKEALDGVITLGSQAALELLEARRGVQSSSSSVKRRWLEEAIDQVRQGLPPR